MEKEDIYIDTPSYIKGADSGYNNHEQRLIATRETVEQNK